MKIGLFFGSFNPVHTGHLLIAEFIASNLTDEVWFVVSPQNPFKDLNELLNVKNRLLLLTAAIFNNPKLKVSDAEISLPIPSFTIDTLYFLKKTNPDHEFFLIMGSDNFLKIREWKSSETLLSDFKILIYERTGYSILSNLPVNITKLETPYINISSTEIRRLIKTKKSIRYMVPDNVIQLIKRNDFYT